MAHRGLAPENDEKNRKNETHFVPQPHRPYGGPVGTNARYYYAEMFWEVANALPRRERKAIIFAGNWRAE